MRLIIVHLISATTHATCAQTECNRIFNRYIDSEPLLPMEDAAFKKLLPVLETILATGGEDRLLQILLGVAKDASLTTEQAIVVAHMFSHEKRQRLIYQQVSEMELGPFCH